MSSPLPYEPPEHLVSSSGLTATQLTSQFEAFKSSLRFASTSPELVFERVVANLCAAKPNTTPETTKNSADLKKSIEDLQLRLTALQDDVKTLVLEKANLSDMAAHSAPVHPPVPPSSPIKFSFVPAELGLGVRADSYDSEDGMYGDECSWSDLQYEDERVQFGSYNTAEEQVPVPIGTSLQTKIEFSSVFPSPPTVVVWFTGVDMRCERPCRVGVFAKVISEISFDIFIVVSEPQILYSIGVSWVAFPTEESGYSVGEFDTVLYATCQRFGIHKGAYIAPSKSLLAINKYVRGYGGNMSFVLRQRRPFNGGGIIWTVEKDTDSISMCELSIVYIGCA